MSRQNKSTEYAQPAIPERLMNSLELSKSQADAGESAPLDQALDRLRASIARMKAKRAAQD